MVADTEIMPAAWSNLHSMTDSASTAYIFFFFWEKDKRKEKIEIYCLSLAETGGVVGRYPQRNGSQTARQLAWLRLSECLVSRGLFQRGNLEVVAGVSLQYDRRSG
jgi:hypothetical protein